MSKLLDNLYRNSPIWFQDIMCTLYGYNLHRERYSGIWGSFYQELLKSQYWSSSELHNLQNRLFMALIEHALSSVPYYRETLKDLLQLHKDNDHVGILKELPVLSKETVRSNTKEFISECFIQKELLTFNTSGTTGSPLTVFITLDDRRRNYAFFERAKSWAGVALFDKSATFAGRTIVPANQKQAPYWRKNRKFNNTLFSSYHLSNYTLPSYVEKIRKLNPIYIDSYLSSITQIATYCLETKITDICLKAVITSAEMLLDSQREKAEKAFQCKVYDQYGCTEQSVFACQCESGNYHVNSEFGILEVLDNNNNPVAEGEIGNFVCTGFLNTAMPLIRYKLGDMGIISTEKCSCGRKFPVIEKIYGRNDDILRTPDGKYIGRLDPVFKGVESSIVEAQIVQEKIDLIRIYIVPGKNYKHEHGQYIVNELKKRMGREIVFQVEFVEKIARTKNGKFRSVVNRISSHY